MIGTAFQALVSRMSCHWQSVRQLPQLHSQRSPGLVVPAVPARSLDSAAGWPGALPGGEGSITGTILITGAGGSIGSALCQRLLCLGPAKLVLLDHSETNLYQIDRRLRLESSGDRPMIVPALGSVTDSRFLRRLMALHPPQTVFHAAACKHVPLVEMNPLAGIETNVLGTQRLLDASLNATVRRFILVSTDKAVRPQGVMGATKRLAELLVQDSAREAAITRFAIVRFGNVLGSSGSVLPLFREQVARGGPVTLTDPEATRYFMTPDEAIDLLLVSADLAERRNAPTFVPRMGRAISMRAFAESVIREAGLRPRDVDHPDGDIEITSIGLRSGEKLHEELHLSAHPRPTLHPRILRIDEPSLSQSAMALALEELETAIRHGSDTAGRKALFRWAAVEADALAATRRPTVDAAPLPARGPHLLHNATGGG